MTTCNIVNYKVSRKHCDLICSILRIWQQTHVTKENRYENFILFNWTGWLKASQTFFLLSTAMLFLEIIYTVITVARKTLRMSVVAGLSNVTGKM